MRLFLSIFFSVIIGAVFAQYNDPNYAKPTTGYGADGTHTVGIISFTNPHYPAKDIEIYYPSDITSKVPTIFYSHAFGGNVSANISGMLNFVAKKGYAIVYVPYQTIGVTIDERYSNLLNGFRKAARNYSAIIDTTKVGFMGHSFGGGASFGIAYKCFTENNWGKEGRFIYALAQWYTFNIEELQLESYPSNTKLLTEVFDDDVTNDHRMAIDIFEHISIEDSEKDFILVKSDTINNYTYAADHALPNNSSAFDALDYYAYYRFIDALCDYTFNASAEGKKVALGNGSTEQITMPIGLKPLFQTDNPSVVYPEIKYLYPCSDNQNLRKDYCPQVVTAIDKYKTPENNIKVFPNPSIGNTTIIFPLNISANLMVFNSLGNLVFKEVLINKNQTDIDLTELSDGIYFVKVGSFTEKFVLSK